VRRYATVYGKQAEGCSFCIQKHKIYFSWSCTKSGSKGFGKKTPLSKYAKSYIDLKKFTLERVKNRHAFSSHWVSF
jgi:hypothetical protein